MDSYLVLKLLHILSAVVLAGTGTGIAFFMFMASRSSNTEAIAVTASHVVLADWLFTAPAVVVQFITGVLLMMKLGFSFTSPWFLVVISLFVFIGACWIPVVVIQYKLKQLADASRGRGEVTPEFKRLMRWWTLLGIPAFTAILVIFVLMVFKPLPLA
ncbi:DUF2269 family protein [Maricurvus nonylphenolicus]|uniref:DUF2269 family protein n=1 Tax=Maricurvus nonylphenolicus TaxID=1008307 RepID=UPI0036F1F832